MTWPTKKLGEVIEFQYGKGIDKSQRDERGEVPIYGANGVLGHTNKALKSGEAVIVGRKGSAGELTRVSGKFWPSDVTYYVFGNDKVDIDYLFYFLRNANLTRLATGVKPGINRNRVYEIEIPLPPLAEQRKIVARIEKRFSKIDEAARLSMGNKASAAQLLPAALHEIFSQAESRGWEQRNIGDKGVMKITSGGTPSRGQSKYYGGEVMWLKSGELNDNTNIVDSQEHITELAVQESSAKIFPAGTILLAMYGATAGKLGILGRAAATNQAVAGLICNEEKLSPKFLYHILTHIRNEIIAQAWGGAQPNLSQTIIKTFKIPLPPLVEQKAIVEKLDALSGKVRALQELQMAQAADLKALKQSILHEAFKSEPSNEPTNIEMLTPSPFFRNQVNAAIIEQVTNDGGETTEVAVAKYNHMLQMLCGVPLAYEFQKGYFGPFDGQIKRLLYSGLGKNAWFRKKGGMVIAGSNITALTARKSGLYLKARAGMQTLASLGITRLDALRVELLSTICHAVQQTQSTDFKKIREFMSTWQTDGNRSKAEKFTSAQTQKCLDFILAHELHKKLIARGG